MTDSQPKTEHAEGKCLLEVSGLSLTIGGRRLLDDVSFTLPEGCFCSVIGPNGAGKTTLLKCLCRLHDRWQGTVRVNGRDTHGMTQLELARLFGYVPQVRDVPPAYEVEDFLKMSRFAAGHDDEQHIIDDALECVGMTSFRHRMMDTLSGGEAQKVFIAAGIVQAAPVLLLDEPAAFLDPKYQLEVRSLLAYLNEERGMSIVCVTHDVNGALASSRLLLALNHGRVAFFCTPENALTNHCLEELYGMEFERLRNSSGQPVIVPVFHN
ncbi:MAG: ABC transporter ATP-binding protein [Victivallales bacterium]|nr:ABC transporter ATP-binding protein [Victivallales bacterium]